MQIQNLDYLEADQKAIRGGFVVNSTTIVVLQKSLASAKALAYYGNANATASAVNLLGLAVGAFPP